MSETRATAGLLLGVDLGGTAVKLGICTPQGTILERRVIPTDAARGPDDTMQRVAAAAHALIESVGPVVVCGVSVPGPLDTGRRFLIRAANLPGWTDVAVPALLREQLGVPTILENDANCAAWAEYGVGIGRGAHSLVLYTLGTGVGAGIVLCGDVWLGVSGAAGRLGHIVIDPAGPDCRCGQKGCLEQYASATAVARDYGRGTARDAFDAARRGEPDAVAVIDRACSALAAGVTSTIQVIEPELVVLAGGISAAGDVLLERVRAGVLQHALAGRRDRIRIELTALGADGGWIGAALWARRQFDTTPDAGLDGTGT